MKKRLFALLLALLIAALGLFAGLPYKDPASVGPASDEAFSDTLSADDKGFEKAYKPRPFSFPDDFGPHPRYRTEWWYFTGNLQDKRGRKFGYELTFFRFALTADAPVSKSAWRASQLYMAHLAVTDVESGRFYADERFSRAGIGLAGARSAPFRVWLYDWSARGGGKNAFPLRLSARNDEVAIGLHLDAQQAPVLQGDRGLSQKSPEPGNASYYFSFTRIATAGTVAVKGKVFDVTGDSWMDREWSTSALAEEQSGWDWFALQLDDGSELMFYRFRRKDGLSDLNSSGAWFLADRSAIPLSHDDVTIETLARWQSPHSKITYPSRWRLSVPKRNLQLDIVPLLNDQELNLSYRYWEGAVAVRGQLNGKALRGKGYVELTGYRR
ncbi:MAG: lipocalin-like domain-containing protein [Gammaproteobacteria bacterium]